MDFDFLDADVFMSPAYWIIVGLAIVGLLLGFGASGFVSGGTGADVGISTMTKAIILILIFPIAYVIIKFINR